MTIRIYVIDTSSLIELNQWYPSSNFPSFWQKVETLIEAGRLKAPIQVLNEIKRKDDDISKWCNDMRNKLFVNDNEEIRRIANNILENNPRLLNPYKPNKDECADPYVVALAIYLKQYTIQQPEIVVITEDYRRNCSLSNVCKEKGINPIRLSELAREESWKF